MSHIRIAGRDPGRGLAVYRQVHHGGIGVWVRRALFGISPEEATFSRRGFHPTDPARQEHLEWIGRVFVKGYETALSSDQIETLGTQLDQIDGVWRGFAYEGAGMALALLDHLWVGRGRVAAFLDGPGAAHRYMVFVGVGWAYARLRKRLPAALLNLDPLLGWLVADGYGFHEGYFHPRTTIAAQRRPRAIQGYARRVFDQGVGRSLLFVCGANVESLCAALANFAPERRSDLWAGVGLAAAYAGAFPGHEVQSLLERSGRYAFAVAQGVAFGAEARERAGNMTSSTQEAVKCVWRREADEVARLVRLASQDLSTAGARDLVLYEVWRQRIQNSFPEERGRR